MLKKLIVPFLISTNFILLTVAHRQQITVETLQFELTEALEECEIRISQVEQMAEKNILLKRVKGRPEASMMTNLN